MATAIADGEQAADRLLHALPAHQPQHEDQHGGGEGGPDARPAGRRCRWRR